MMESPFGGLPTMFFSSALWVLVVWAITAIVHIAFAWAVWADTDGLWRKQKRNPELVAGPVWALATLLGGVFVAGLYWAMHHSTLRPPKPPE